MAYDSPEGPRRFDKLSRRLGLAFRADRVVTREPELQHITCDRWNVWGQGPCQKSPQPCIGPAPHRQGSTITLVCVYKSVARVRWLIARHVDPVVCEGKGIARKADQP